MEETTAAQSGNGSGSGSPLSRDFHAPRAEKPRFPAHTHTHTHTHTQTHTHKHTHTDRQAHTHTKTDTHTHTLKHTHTHITHTHTHTHTHTQTHSQNDQKDDKVEKGEHIHHEAVVWHTFFLGCLTLALRSSHKERN